MDSSRLADRLRAAVEAGHLLGAALAVIDRDDTTVAVGRTSVEDEGVAVTPTTLFDLGSIAKMFCAALVMRLVEAGALDLDQPVEQSLPGFAFDDREHGPRVTLRHLLSHSSGLPSAGKDWGPCGPGALRDFAYEQLVHYRFVAPPGRLHLYSNTAICLAGHVAEAATGRTYRDHVQAEVLDPLGMTRTTFDRAVAMTRRVALPHERDEGGRLVACHRWTDNRSGEPSSFAVGPVVDLARVARMHLGRGRLGDMPYLSAASIDAMHRPHVSRRTAGASHPFTHLYAGYGLGLMTGTYRGARVLRHGGTSQSFNCFLELLPDVGHGFVLLTNAGDDAAVGELVLSLYDELLGLTSDDRAVPPPPSSAEAPWPEHEGTYLDAARGRLATVRPIGASLVLDVGGGARPLVAIGAGAFYAPRSDGAREPVAFVSGDGDGGATGWMTLGGQPFRRIAIGTPAPEDRAAWSAPVGTYVDPSNLGDGAEVRIDLDGERLRFETDWDDGELTPLGPRRFIGSIGLVEFGDDAQWLSVGGATRYLRVAKAGC
jgi:CubicO group peptidase (beta-lactamase class C family)